VQVSCGGFHSSVLTESGKVYTWGDGRMGQLGNLARKHNMHSIPHLVENFITMKITITQVACGQSHTCALTTTGTLYSWGSGKCGQLGHSSRLDERYPRLVDVDRNAVGRITQVACGDRHTAAISSNAQVITFGAGQHGQLGHGDGEDQLRPKVVEALQGTQIKAMDCGATLTACVTEVGVLYIWGFGESVHPKEYTNIVDKPRVVKMKQQVKQVACGQSHALVLTTGGDVYAFGNARMGQIGHGSRSNVRLPRLVLKGKDVYQISAGRYHSMAVTSFGILYSWGCGESGQLAHNSLEGEYFPRVIEPIMPNVVGQISAGEHHSFCLASIEHASISPDVLRWKRVEDEELKMKQQMVEKQPNGLKSKHILWLERERAQIVRNIEEQERREQEQLSKHLQEQVSSVQSREALVTDVRANYLMPGEETKTLDDTLQLMPADSPSQRGGGGGLSPSASATSTQMLNSLSTSQLEQQQQQLQGQLLHGRNSLGGAGAALSSSASTLQLTGNTLDEQDEQDARRRTTRLGGPASAGLRSSMSAPALALRAGGTPNRGVGAGVGAGAGAGVGALADKKRSVVGAPAIPLGLSLGKRGGLFSSAARAASDAADESARSMSMSSENSYNVAGGSKRPATRGGEREGGREDADGRMVLRPSTADHTVTMCFNPVGPRVNFSEHTQKTLGSVKKFLTSGVLAHEDFSDVRLLELKRQYNEVNNELRLKANLLAELEQCRVSTSLPEDERTRAECERRIKDLKMKLVTLNTRLMEAEENKKNYELYIIRMKEEDVSLSKQIDQLRQLAVEYERLLTKLDRMSVRVVHQRGDLEHEINNFQTDIVDFAGFGRMHLVKFRELIEMDTTVRSPMKRQLAIKDGKGEKKESTDRELESHMAEMNAIRNDLATWEGKVDFYEKRFHKITAATGLSEPEDIINKFHFNREVSKDLLEQIKIKTAEQSELAREKEERTAVIEARRAGFVPSQWRDVGDLQDSAIMEKRRLSKEQMDVDRLLERLTYVQEGTEALAREMESKDPKGLLVPAFSGIMDEAVWWLNEVKTRVHYIHEVTKLNTEKKDDRLERAANLWKKMGLVGALMK
jgi:hypothetical protein